MRITARPFLAPHGMPDARPRALASQSTMWNCGLRRLAGTRNPSFSNRRICFANGFLVDEVPGRQVPARSDSQSVPKNEITTWPPPPMILSQMKHVLTYRAGAKCQRRSSNIDIFRLADCFDALCIGQTERRDPSIRMSYLVCVEAHACASRLIDAEDLNKSGGIAAPLFVRPQSALPRSAALREQGVDRRF